VGLERQEKSFSRSVYRELLRRGYDVVPVNPALAEAEGRRAFPRVDAIAPPVEAALIMTPPGRAAEVAQSCLDAGVRHLWFHRGAGPGSASPEALALCRAAGVTPVTDLCPYMALPGPGWFHSLHAFFRRGGRSAS
jgi:uncharacterized protein